MQIAPAREISRRIVLHATRSGLVSPRGYSAALPPRGQLHSFAAKGPASPYEYGVHRSDAEERIAQLPVVEVDGEVALCTGGGGALGHPLEYIKLLKTDNEPVECRYCGIRYKMKEH
ncbi:unnamed protein product [Discosporangium mesarthrocarpum]